MYIKEIKKIIEENITNAMHGILFARNIAGDIMTTIYKNGEVQVDICYEWEYFEVFGLTKEEREDIYIYYIKLVKEINENE